jgi:hypothetical protein
MELARCSVFNMIHSPDANVNISFEERVNIALHLSKGLEVRLRFLMLARLI